MLTLITILFSSVVLLFMSFLILIPEAVKPILLIETLLNVFSTGVDIFLKDKKLIISDAVVTVLLLIILIFI